MMFLYDLPDWQMGCLIAGSCMGGSLFGFVLLHRICHISFTDEQRGSAMNLLATIATINSLLLAFSAVSVWEAFNDADSAVVNEANTAGQLARDLAVFGSFESQNVRLLLKNYLGAVIADEWPVMSRSGELEPTVWEKFDTMFRVAGTIEPDTARRQALMPEIWARVNELAKHRRARGEAGTAEVPEILWVVVGVGAVISCLLLYALDYNRFNTTLIGAFSLALGLVFYFIIALDHPFAGKNSVSADPYRMTVNNMEKWDERFPELAH